MAIGDNLNNAKKILKEIEDVYRKLGEENPFKNFDASKDSIEDVKKDLEAGKKLLKEMETEADGLFSSFRAIQEEVSTTNKAYSAANRSITSMTSIAGKLRDHQNGISTLSTKQLQTLQSKLKSEQENLKISQSTLQEKHKSKTIDDKEYSMLVNINGLLDEKDSSLKSLNATAQKELELRQNIDKQVGITGGVLKGISKIPVIGNIFDANSALKDMEDHLSEVDEQGNQINNSVSALGVGFKNIGNQIIGGVLNPANLLLGAITGIISAITNVDKQTGEMAKSMNLTYSQSLNTRKELTQMAAMSGDVALNTSRLQETLTSVNKELGTSGKLSENDLKTFTKLREQAGMTQEEIMGMQKFSMVMGGDLKKNVVSFQAQAKSLSMSKGVAINVKALMGDMAKVSNRTKLSIEGGADGLATAAVNAKLMGSNLDQVASIADSLLNFESSIEKELEAELLLGKDISLEKARQAALNNDMATVAEEITKQAGSAAEFGKMNRIQQEAIASAMGMSADQMGDMLYEQEALKSIGKSLNEEEQKAFDLAKEKYGVEEAARMLKSDAAGEGLQGLLDQQSAQEDFTQSVEKMKEIFVDIAQTVLPAVQAILQPIFTIMSGVSTIIGYILQGFKAMPTPLKVIVGLLSALALKTKIAAIFSVIKGAWQGLGGLPVVGPALALAAIAGGVGYINSQKADDMVSPGDGSSGYGKRTLMGPEGAIQLNNKDTVIAGTNLFGDDVKSEPGKSTETKPAGSMQAGGAKIDMSQTNALLQQLITAVTTGGVVMLDGQKVGQALNLGARKMQ